MTNRQWIEAYILFCWERVRIYEARCFKATDAGKRRYCAAESAQLQSLAQYLQLLLDHQHSYECIDASGVCLITGGI